MSMFCSSLQDKNDFSPLSSLIDKLLLKAATSLYRRKQGYRKVMEVFNYLLAYLPQKAEWASYCSLS